MPWPHNALLACFLQLVYIFSSTSEPCQLLPTTKSQKQKNAVVSRGFYWRVKNIEDEISERRMMSTDGTDTWTTWQWQRANPTETSILFSKSFPLNYSVLGKSLFLSLSDMPKLAIQSYCSNIVLYAIQHIPKGIKKNKGKWRLKVLDHQLGILVSKIRHEGGVSRWKFCRMSITGALGRGIRCVVQCHDHYKNWWGSQSAW